MLSTVGLTKVYTNLEKNPYWQTIAYNANSMFFFISPYRSMFFFNITLYIFYVLMFKLDEKDIDTTQKSASAQCLLGLSAILKFVTQDGSHCDALAFYTGK